MDLPEGFKSGLTRFGLGLAALGRPGYINLGHAADLNGRYHPSDMERQTHQVIDLAVQLGVKYIDVAQSYGRGEEFLSSWLRNHRPEDLWVGSKWGYYYTADWQVNAKKHEIKDHSVELLSRQWPESETRLKPYLKLYQVHSATLESGVLQNTKVLEELARIKAGGYVIGLSLSGEQQAEVLRKALDIKVDEDTLFGSVQATYNLLEQSVTPALEEAHDRGLAIIAKETLANGRLTTRNKGAAYFEVLQAMASNTKPLSMLCRWPLFWKRNLSPRY